MNGKILDVSNDCVLTNPKDQIEQLKKDILSGLTKTNKQIPSKYFYDDEGCELYDKITRHKDYYLTDCELEIINTHKTELANLFKNDELNLIELGPGEGIKTQILIDEFMQNALTFNYYPIDISKKYLQKIIDKQIPKLHLTAINSDYIQGLKWLNMSSARRNFVLFLGSSIGNFEPESMGRFFRELWSTLNNGDYVFMGFDLKKEIKILLRAYNDSAGITRDFNLNLLQRLNRELDANFNIDKFQHHASYNVYTGAMESFLISLENQLVKIPTLEKTFDFYPFEPVHVEYSYKYTLAQIREIAKTAGFKIRRNFIDSKEYFVDSLWQTEK